MSSPSNRVAKPAAWVLPPPVAVRRSTGLAR